MCSVNSHEFCHQLLYSNSSCIHVPSALTHAWANPHTHPYTSTDTYTNACPTGCSEYYCARDSVRSSWYHNGSGLFMQSCQTAATDQWTGNDPICCVWHHDASSIHEPYTTTTYSYTTSSTCHHDTSSICSSSDAPATSYKNTIHTTIIYSYKPSSTDDSCKLS